MQQLQDKVIFISILVNLEQSHQIIMLQTSQHLQLVKNRFLYKKDLYLTIFHRFKSLFLENLHCSLLTIIFANTFIYLSIVSLVNILPLVTLFLPRTY